MGIDRNIRNHADRCGDSTVHLGLTMGGQPEHKWVANHVREVMDFGGLPAPPLWSDRRHDPRQARFDGRPLARPPASDANRWELSFRRDQGHDVGMETGRHGDPLRKRAGPKR